MTTGQWYRHSISKRAAVSTVIEIAKVISPHGTVDFYGYTDNRPEQFDGAVLNLAYQVELLKKEVEEYRKLKQALQPIIKGVR